MELHPHYTRKIAVPGHLWPLHCSAYFVLLKFLSWTVALDSIDQTLCLGLLSSFAYQAISVSVFPLCHCPYIPNLLHWMLLLFEILMCEVLRTYASILCNHLLTLCLSTFCLSVTHMYTFDPSSLNRRLLYLIEHLHTSVW